MSSLTKQSSEESLTRLIGPLGQCAAVRLMLLIPNRASHLLSIAIEQLMFFEKYRSN